MATKAKESIVVGKEKKAPSSNSHITNTKRTTKPSQTTTSSTNNSIITSTPSSDKNIPNYLKPTISSRLESPSSFKHPKSDAIAPNKPNLNRRRSFDRPLSSSNLAKQKQPSPSRLHKALVSPGPRERIVSHRSSTVPVKSTKPSKPISDKASKNPKEGKTKLLYVKKSTTSNHSTRPKKVANDHASANSTNVAKNTTKGSKVETEEVKEVTNQEVEVIKIMENEENQVEHASEISQHVDIEHDNEQHEHDHHGLEESVHQPHNQGNDHDEKVISTVSEGELKNEPQEEKTEDEEHEEEENTNHDDSNNNGNHQEEQSAAEEEQEEEEVVVNEKEDEGGVVNVIEDHTSENNDEEEEAVVEEIEVVEGGTSEQVEEAKVEATPPKQQGKREQSQVSNDVIEETASKLLEERKNKVRALAGAFQTVIDYQTTSK